MVAKEDCSSIKWRWGQKKTKRQKAIKAARDKRLHTL